jgi:PAS domain S-box-containing protein
MLGRPAAVTFTPEDVTAGVPETEMATAIREGLAPNVRWHQRSDGSRVFINGSMQPLIGPDGVVRELIKIGQDETETRRVQQALTKSEKQLRTLTEGIPQLVWRSAVDGHWTWSSPQWESLTGQSLAESLGKGWMEAIHPDDHEAALSAWEVARSTGSLDVEYRVRRASDSAWLWHHTRSLPVRDDEEAILEWLGTTTDVQQLKELQERQAVMVAELQHRTRNLITVVGAVARQTMAQTGPTKTFVDEFEHRLAALARVQGLLSRSEKEPVTIGKLIRMELDALGVRGDTELRVKIDGPPVPLRNSIVQTLALAMHELATNALKHGALSQSEGRLSVTWKLLRSEAAERSLSIEWSETGTAGEVEALPNRRGYGRELIERALPYALGAETSYAFTPDGLRCTIVIPLDKKRPRDRRVK